MNYRDVLRYSIARGDPRTWWIRRKFRLTLLFCVAGMPTLSVLLVEYGSILDG